MHLLLMGFKVNWRQQHTSVFQHQRCFKRFVCIVLFVSRILRGKVMTAVLWHGKQALQTPKIPQLVGGSQSWIADGSMALVASLQAVPRCAIEQQASSFWAPGTGFVEVNFPKAWGCAGRFQDDLSALHLLCTLFILLLPPPQIIRHQNPEVGDPCCR